MNVEQARVDVERSSLSNKQEFEGAALQFRAGKAAHPGRQGSPHRRGPGDGQHVRQGQMQIFGDPDTMASMSSSS